MNLEEEDMNKERRRKKKKRSNQGRGKEEEIGSAKCEDAAACEAQRTTEAKHEKHGEEEATCHKIISFLITMLCFYFLLLIYWVG